ncbi:hypothetical protein Rsub_03935 [Raphidocelis subcapitata]|uniref:Uncharacterized protein n=1 Tax=Raphidocelis subcapitata TaxID=307507 RepID=A0A2V0NUR5_9CHLO|nr:hypothetical protein Rsub_03935 [Raphidocelis subcapitata]|eukprot:GBF91079.1 hypothetical protein Rsub_03935 [Raphidocelis subcapitata]
MKLATALLVLALVAGARAQSATPAPATRPAPQPTTAWVCSVTVQFDNTADELDRQMTTIKKELGDEVCDLPDGLFGMSKSEWEKVVLGPSYMDDQSSLFDSKSLAKFHCIGSGYDKASAETACDKCKKYLNRGAGNFGDELEDATSFPEIEVEQVNDCQLEQVAWPIKTVTSKTMRGGSSATPAPSPASSSSSFPTSLISGLLG